MILAVRNAYRVLGTGRTKRRATPTPVEEPEKGATGDLVDVVAKAICRANVEPGSLHSQKAIDGAVEAMWKDYRLDAEAAITALAATNAGQVEAVSALQEARDALHKHYVDWDGEPEDAVPLQLARARCDAAIAAFKKSEVGHE